MRRMLLLSLLLLLLAGCVDYSEELWLNKDGSGRAHMIIGTMTNYQNEQVINRYASFPGIHLISKSVYKKQNYTYFKLDFRFDSLQAFNSLNDQVSNTDFFGKLVLTKEKGGKVTLSRRVSLGSNEGEDDEIEQLMFPHTQPKLRWTYILHLPWKVVKSNAAPSNIDYKNNTVKWSYQTAYLWNKSQTMTVTMQKSLPWTAYLLIGIAALLIIASLLWWRKHYLLKPAAGSTNSDNN